jgi:TonB family protein
MALRVPSSLRDISESVAGDSMRSNSSKKMMLALGVMTLFTAAATLAQSSSTERKVKNKVAPTYPELARRMSVAGKVRIEVVITQDGRVRSTKVIGGHPILVQACQDAVREWKFTPAGEETTQIVEFDFRGLGN